MYCKTEDYNHFNKSLEFWRLCQTAMLRSPVYFIVGHPAMALCYVALSISLLATQPWLFEIYKIFSLHISLNISVMFEIVTSFQKSKVLLKWF